VKTIQGSREASQLARTFCYQFGKTIADRLIILIMQSIQLFGEKCDESGIKQPKFEHMTSMDSMKCSQQIIIFQHHL
jgi:hypothetical protein